MSTHKRRRIAKLVEDIAAYNETGNDSQEDTETLQGWIADARELMPDVAEDPERCPYCRIEDAPEPGKRCAECSQGEAEKAGEDR